MNDLEWDETLSTTIAHINDEKYAYLVLIIDGKDVTFDKYHQADNIDDYDMLKVLHVLRARVLERIEREAHEPKP